MYVLSDNTVNYRLNQLKFWMTSIFDKRAVFFKGSVFYGF